MMDIPDLELYEENSYIIEKDNAVKALYKTDLTGFLEKAGILTDFNSGKITCRYCKGVISDMNLFALIPCRDHLDFCCSESDCTILFTTGAGYD